MSIKEHESVIARNASFAASEKIAFAFTEGKLDLESYRDQPEVDTLHPELATANAELLKFVVSRVRELQLLTHWPLVLPPRKIQVNVAMSLEPWTALGEDHLRILALPVLPALVRKDLLTPMELLLAMAGQLNRDVSGTNSQVSSQHISKGTSAMPWSLGLVTFLPTLRTIQSPSLGWLRTFFADLRPQHRHIGLDDRVSNGAWFKDLKLQSARALLREGSTQMSRSFLRFGTPHGVRAQVWEAAMCLGPLRPLDVDHFASLCNTAQAQQTLMDIVICDDIADIADSEQFFLFEDMLRAVVLAISRDHHLPLHTAVEVQPSVASVLGALPELGISSLPCSMVHVHGTAMMAAPLCFLYQHPAAVYRMFRSLYARYWSKLHSLVPVGGRSPTLPILMKTYEDLLQELDPEVVAHVHQIGLPVSALSIRWICSAFIGHLPIEEVLLLWDRVVGLDSLLPLPLMAVAVVCFRRQIILTCQSCTEVIDVMSDISQLKTIPLMQAALFHA